MKNLIEKDSIDEFERLPIDIQMKLISGETVIDNKGVRYKLEMCLEGIHYKQDGTVEIIKDREG